ncbi:hypothetical protein ACCO45_002847 [Purpureocillium lilacinum]|uniref:Uncharacterized protein n=1 Tax=Purpureocillium lilacinum TaxID=33203 RepID=A0ACC4DYB9_PURLI
MCFAGRCKGNRPQRIAAIGYEASVEVDVECALVEDGAQLEQNEELRHCEHVCGRLLNWRRNIITEYIPVIDVLCGPAHALNLFHDSDHIQAHNELHIVLIDPSSQKLLDYAREARSVVQIRGPFQHSIKIGSDAHVSVTNRVAHIRDVINNGCHARRFAISGYASLSCFRWGDKRGNEADHDEAAICFKLL